jgi:hypothetical protein
MNTGNINCAAGGLFHMSGEAQKRVFHAMRLCLAATLLAAASAQTSLAKPAKSQLTQRGPAGGLSELMCKNGGREAKLTASRVRKGDRHYLEFRTRILPGSPSGHLYVVFGELDARSNVVSRYQTGLMPVGSILGFYRGTLAPVPGKTEPQYLDCYGGTLGAWRISVSAAQYNAIVRKARASLKPPPLWSMFGHNCNHFAAEFGDLAGLQRPKNPALPSVSYLPAYIEANK